MRESLGRTRNPTSMRQLSSRFTFLAKYGAPPLWMVGFGLVTLRAFLHPSLLAAWGAVGALIAVKLVVPLAWLVGSVRVVRWATRVKRVRVDGDFLLISNYVREVRVPIEALIDIHPGERADSPITLGFKDPTPFGGPIVLIPARPTDLLVWRDNHVAEQLRRLARFDSDETRAT